MKIQVWNLSKNNAGKRTNQLDIEPIINYRYVNSTIEPAPHCPYENA